MVVHMLERLRTMVAAQPMKLDVSAVPIWC